MNQPIFNGQSTLLLRLQQMLLGWGTVGLIYTLTGHWPREAHVMRPSWLDEAILYEPRAIWLYLSFFILIPCAYLTCPVGRLRWLRSSMQLTALIAGLVYLVWPTTLAYPADLGSGWSAQTLAALIAVDSVQNCFPSLHVALTALAVWAMCEQGRPIKTLLLLVWALAIAFSVVQLRRHLLVDVFSGALLTWMAGAWTWGRMQKKYPNTETPL